MAEVHDKVRKKDKKEKKEKKEKKSKQEIPVAAAEEPKKVSKKKSSKSSGSSTSVSASLNLLDLDFGSVPSIAAAPQSMAAGVVDKNEKKEKKQKETSKKDKKTGGVWLSFYTGRSVDIFYSIGDSGLRRISFKLVNRGPPGMTISADLAVKSFAPFQSLTGNTVKLAHHASSAAEVESYLELDMPSSDAIPGNIQLASVVRVMLESASGVETLNANTLLKIPVCATFTPNNLDEAAFATSISKSSSRWGSSNTRVVSALKPKYSFRSLASFLRAYIVEAEPSKAASFAAKTASGAKVFCLAKVSKDGGSVIVEVKVLGSSKSDSQGVADSLASALGEISL